jgi:hypothetical protein
LYIYIHTHTYILLDDAVNEDEMAHECGMHGEEVHIMCWWGKLKVSGRLEDLVVDGRLIVLKWIFKKEYERARAELIWLWIAANGGLLRGR